MPAISESARRAYLDALEIDVWTERRETVVVDSAIEAVARVQHAEWPQLRETVKNCTDCGLHTSRTQTVFGVGDENANWMIIGEAPGAEEDRRGEPFVGRAGQLLDEMLRAVGLTRNAVFIANILKCRPPNNRDPAVDEAAACRAYLERQIDLVQPRLVLAVGRIAAQHLLQTDSPIGKLRGQEYWLRDGQLPLVVTYHPAYLLRSPSQKYKVWADLRMARRIEQELPK